MRRIYKKRPFSAPNSVRVNEMTNICDKLIDSRADVMKIRDLVKAGKMSDELYDFLNMDGSMDALLGGLPRQNNQDACESLTMFQLEFLDATVEDLGENLKKIKATLWDAFKEWFLDWWDVNRQTKILLRSKHAQFSSNASSFGDAAKFEAMTIPVYLKTQWEAMLQSCVALNNLTRDMPDKELPRWFNENKSKIESALSTFGKSVVMPGPRIIEGLPFYEIHEMTMRTAGWRFNLLGADLQRTINVMSDEIESRRLFGKMEKLFNSATENDMAAIRFARQLVMHSKANTYVVARTIKRIILTAESRAKKRAPAPAS